MYSICNVVKEWRQTSKYVTNELLTMMAQYDPTGIQKKARIRRAKKVMKRSVFMI